MTTKSRSNYRIGFCYRTDCLNRDVKCNICLFYNQYKNINDDTIIEVSDEKDI